MYESKNNLKELVEHIKPIFYKHGFEYEPAHNSFSSGGEFANGFFIHPKIKIGLIFRSDRFGSVNYETDATNISHDMFFNGLKRGAEQKLFYDSGGFCSFTLDDQSIKDALLQDLENIIIPYIINTPIEQINLMMLKEREKMWK